MQYRATFVALVRKYLDIANIRIFRISMNYFVNFFKICFVTYHKCISDICDAKFYFHFYI